MSDTPILDAVQAALADGTLTPAQRSRLVASIKASGLRDALVAFSALPQEWTVVRGAVTFVVTLNEIIVNDVDLHLMIAVTRNGKALRLNLPIVLRNAPFQVLSGTVIVYDPVGAVRAVVVDAIAAAVIR